jgi:hypothetical protein
MMPEPRSWLLTSSSARVDKVCTELEPPVHFFALDDPRTLSVMPKYHAGGAVSRINTIGHGGSIDFMADFLPSEVARVLVEEGITDVVFVPAMIEAPLVRVPGFADLESPRLDTITFGASPHRC